MKFPNTFRLIVRTNRPRTEILGFDNEKEAYRMNVHALPEKGKANVEIVRFFRKEFKLDVRIVAGGSSKQKLLRVL